MNKAKWLLLVSTVFFAHAHAMEGVFDRSAETARYIEQLKSDLTQEQLIAVAKPIYISGITSDKLSQAIGDRLMQDIARLDRTSESSQYGAWMLKALASTGTDLAAKFITEACAKTSVKRLLQECREQSRELPWHRRKNELMSSRENFSEGGDMRTAQMLNLLKSGDYSYKQDAAYRMSWDRVLDESLMQEIAKQLQVFIAKDGVSKEKAEIVVMSHYVKMLGYSKNMQYRPILDTVIRSKADAMIKGQAKKAVTRLEKK